MTEAHIVSSTAKKKMFTLEHVLEIAANTVSCSKHTNYKSELEKETICAEYFDFKTR